MLRKSLLKVQNGGKRGKSLSIKATDKKIRLVVGEFILADRASITALDGIRFIQIWFNK